MMRRGPPYCQSNLLRKISMVTATEEGGGETGRMRYKDRYGQRERKIYQEGSLGIDHII